MAGGNAQATVEVDLFFSPRNDGFPYDEVYNYSLAGSERSIRLIDLLPGSADDIVSCQLVGPVSLGTEEGKCSVEYEAISYCAGDPTDCLPMMLNGHRFNVFKSLWAVLKQLRLSDAKRILWIDQICMNQTDIPERNAQVQLMRDIYQQAASTQIWLGPKGFDTDAGFDLLERFLSNHRRDLRRSILQCLIAAQNMFRGKGDRLKSFPPEVANLLMSEFYWANMLEGVKSFSVPQGFDYKPIESAYKWIHDSYLNHEYGRAWNAIRELLRHPWWTRCWIIQEAVVSANLTLQCGNRRVAWEDLVLLGEVAMINGLGQSATETTLPAEFTRPWGNCCTLAFLRRMDAELPLKTVLMLTQDRQAADPRDKLYSTLGLLTPEQRRRCSITPDYSPSNTLVDVYTSAAKAVILADRMWLFELLTGYELSAQLPSWAPNWCHTSLTGVWDSQIRYQAGGRNFAAPEFLEGGKTMKIAAVQVGVLHRLCPLIARQRTPEVIETWLDWMTENLEKLPYGTDHLLGTFCRTISLGTQTYEGAPSENGDAEGLESYWTEQISQFANTPSLTRDRSRLHLCLTRNKCYLGLVTEHAVANDSIFVIPGVKTPLVVRPSESEAHYTVIGECYVQGIMNGELIGKAEAEGGQAFNDIFLV